MTTSNKSPNTHTVQVDFPHKKKIMLSMHKFIENAVIVEGDGYCGFYDVCMLYMLVIIISYVLIFFYKCNQWFRLLSPTDWYKESFNKVKHALTPDRIGPTPPNKWMIMLNMSFLIVQKFQYMVVLLSIKMGDRKLFSFTWCTITKILNLVSCTCF